MKQSVTFLTTCLLLYAHAFATAAEDGKHLFILSGQSNMKKLNPDISFTPTVEAAFGKENVIVVKDAQNGKPIALWYKAWKSPEGHPPKTVGGLYNRLMGSVNVAIQGKNIKTVTFVWMQGESDTNPDLSGDYEVSLKGLIEQLRTDMGRQDINVVIGRLSDFQTDDENPNWMVVRKTQMAVAEADPRGAWVDTDDLNNDKGTVGADGKLIKDVHYTTEGFRLLGERFAKKAIELIKKPNKTSP
ncbi:MAG: sialate O-acetylesterase [Planctomycetia bacterium]|nr:sialate O-acetylesterase [Planctomycetia bacterium]